MEKDKALERRFQQVYVKQPNVEDTVSIRLLHYSTWYFVFTVLLILWLILWGRLWG